MGEQIRTAGGQAPILAAMTLVCMQQMFSSDEQVQEGASSRRSKSNSDFMKKSDRNKGVPGHLMDTHWIRPCIRLYMRLVSLFVNRVCGTR